MIISPKPWKRPGETQISHIQEESLILRLSEEAYPSSRKFNVKIKTSTLCSLPMEIYSLYSYSISTLQLGLHSGNHSLCRTFSCLKWVQTKKCKYSACGGRKSIHRKHSYLNYLHCFLTSDEIFPGKCTAQSRSVGRRVPGAYRRWGRSTAHFCAPPGSSYPRAAPAPARGDSTC